MQLMGSLNGELACVPAAKRGMVLGGVVVLRPWAKPGGGPVCWRWYWIGWPRTLFACPSWLVVRTGRGLVIVVVVVVFVGGAQATGAKCTLGSRLAVSVWGS